jgi:large subunit ribosomal protein L13
MKTYSPKPEHIERRWYVMDANGQVLGRLASEVATILRGKHKPMFAPHMDTGDHVIVINADKIELTGNKGEDKYAYYHSGYPGGIRAVQYKDLMAKRPVAAVEKAIKGMLPKNSLGRQMVKKLHVVAGGEHPHAAQKPVALAVGERPAWDGLPTKTTAPAPTKAPAKVKVSATPEAEEPKVSATPEAEEPKVSATPEAAKPKTTAAKPKTTAAKRKTTTAKSKSTTPKAKSTTAKAKSATAKAKSATAKAKSATAKAKSATAKAKSATTKSRTAKPKAEKAETSENEE